MRRMSPTPATTTRSPALQATTLHKSYGSRTAVDGISLQVQGGELLGLLGPNGAGKSTLISLLCGLTPADAGQVQVAGLDLARQPHACKQRIGLVTQDLALFEDLSTRENLVLFGALYGLKGAALQARSAAVLQAVGLADRTRDKPATFSGGMKRRLHIACALLHDPDVLLLDEPTAGVDPQSRNAIFDTLLQLKAAGKALVYTTHYMEEVERLADRIVIVDAGRVVAQGTLAELVQGLPATRQLDISIDDGRPAGDSAALAAQHWLLLQAGARQAVYADGRWQLQLGNAPDRAQPGAPAGDDALGHGTLAVLQAVQQAGWHVRHLASGRASLEDVFLQLTGRQLRDPA